jgi:cytidyltransferase-like protein
MKSVAVSGGFDPVHIGHIRLFREASQLGNLTVILNSDDFLVKKKGFVFMPLRERLEILQSIRFVSSVVVATDKDMTVCDTLSWLKPDIFANGGDRTEGNTPEYEVCKKLGIEMVFGVGGSKMQSSSQLTKRLIK